MALIVEDGTGLATAESYISVADATTYFANRGNATWAALSDAAKEQALRKGTDYMEQRYRLRWKGIKVGTTQALSWPREGVLAEDYYHQPNQPAPHLWPDLSYLVPSDIVPVEVARACAELAVRSLSGDLNADLDRGGAIKKVKVDVIEVEYMDNASMKKVYAAIDDMIRVYLEGSALNRSVARA